MAMRLFDSRRRRLWIHGVQTRLLTVNLAYFTAILAVLALVMFGPLVWQLTQDLPLAARDEVVAQFIVLHERVWPALLAAFLCLAAHSIYVSHRIGGPLYQFRRAMRTLGRGDLTVRLRLRRGDYLNEEADAFNELIDQLGAVVRETQDQLAELRTELRRAAPVSDGAAAPALTTARDRLDLIHDQMMRFRTWTPPSAPGLALDAAGRPAPDAVRRAAPTEA